MPAGWSRFGEEIGEHLAALGQPRLVNCTTSQRSKRSTVKPDSPSASLKTTRHAPPCPISPSRSRRRRIAFSSRRRKKSASSGSSALQVKRRTRILLWLLKSPRAMKSPACETRSTTSPSFGLAFDRVDGAGVNPGMHAEEWPSPTNLEENACGGHEVDLPLDGRAVPAKLNPKFEMRNAKQIRMSKFEENRAGRFRISVFGFVSDFAIRISDFPHEAGLSVSLLHRAEAVVERLVGFAGLLGHFVAQAFAPGRANRGLPFRAAAARNRILPLRGRVPAAFVRGPVQHSLDISISISRIASSSSLLRSRSISHSRFSLLRSVSSCRRNSLSSAS